MEQRASEYTQAEWDVAFVTYPARQYIRRRETYLDVTEPSTGQVQTIHVDFDGDHSPRWVEMCLRLARISGVAFLLDRHAAHRQYSEYY